MLAFLDVKDYELDNKTETSINDYSATNKGKISGKIVQKNFGCYSVKLRNEGTVDGDAIQDNLSTEKFKIRNLKVQVIFTFP